MNSALKMKKIKKFIDIRIKIQCFDRKWRNLLTRDHKYGFYEYFRYHTKARSEWKNCSRYC
jgi:hypothetical protein